MRLRDVDAILAEPGTTVAGDSGVVVLRAVLESGVSTVLCAVDRPATPLDTLAAAARDQLVAAYGVRVRRMPHPRICRTVIATAQDPHDLPALLVPPGDMRLAAELSMGESAAALLVVHDEEWLDVDGISVIDPPQTPHGVRGCLRHAAAAAVRTQQPVAVLIRPSVLEGYAAFVTGTRQQLRTSVADPTSTPLGWHMEGPHSGPVIVTPVALEPALTHAGYARHAAMCVVPAGTDHPHDRDIERLRGHDHVVVIDTPACAHSVSIRLALPDTRITAVVVDINRDGIDHLRALLDPVLGVSTAAASPERAPHPYRDSLHARIDHAAGAAREGTLPAPVALAMSLAQPALGIPARIAAHPPTWQAGNGLRLTWAGPDNVSELVEDAADAHGSHLILVHATDSAAVERIRADLGDAATVEYGSAAQPRALAAAIARTAQNSPLARPHILLVLAAAGRTNAGRSVGVDPSLLAGDLEAVAACGGAHENPLGIAEATPGIVEVAATTAAPALARVGPTASRRIARVIRRTGS